MKHVLRLHDIVKSDMVRADGCHVVDSAGQAYADFEAGVWCANLGHNHPRIIEVIKRQSERILHLGYLYTNHLAEEAATAVLEALGWNDGKCVFLSSGSEAVDLGTSIARRLSGKRLGLSFAGAYLSAYGSAGAQAPGDWHVFEWKVCKTCETQDSCDPSCKRLRSIPFDDIASVVFESGNMHGTVRFPPQGPVQQIVQSVRQAGGFLVANEITTGMGRTGTWFGFEHYGLAPEIVALGKGLGNGYPVSAVAVSSDAAERIEATGFRYVQSHQNDPLACAVATEVISVMRSERLIERSSLMGAAFLEKLERLAATSEAVREARGRGLMLVLELDPELMSAASAYDELLKRGFLVGFKEDANVLRFYPPLTIEQAEIDRLLADLEVMLRRAVDGKDHA